MGLLSGRELAISTMMGGKYKFRDVFPLVRKDILRLLFGLAISLVIALAIQNIDVVYQFFGIV